MGEGMWLEATLFSRVETGDCGWVEVQSWRRRMLFVTDQRLIFFEEPLLVTFRYSYPDSMAEIVLDEDEELDSRVVAIIPSVGGLGA